MDLLELCWNRDAGCPQSRGNPGKTLMAGFRTSVCGWVVQRPQTANHPHVNTHKHTPAHPYWHTHTQMYFPTVVPPHMSCLTKPCSTPAPCLGCWWQSCDNPSANTKLRLLQTTIWRNTHTDTHTQLSNKIRGANTLVCMRRGGGIWWEHGGRGQQQCFAYVIAAMGRGLHMWLDPQGTNSACFIIDSSSAPQHRTTGLIPKQTRPCAVWERRMPVYIY